MPVKQWNVGDVLSAADMNAWTVPSAVIKPADTGRNTTTTVTNDPDLVIAVAAGASYWVHGTLEYKGGTQGSSDIKIQINAPSGSTGFTTSLRITTAGNTSTDNTQVGSSIAAGTNGTANIEPFTFWGTVTTAGTAGNVAVAWAQNTSNGTNTTVMTGSALIVQRIG